MIKTRKCFVITIIILLSTIYIKAQQEPQYTQYMFNMMSVNPAYAGVNNAVEALISSRWQWIGVPGAPRSHTFAVQSPINNKNIGLGASVITDKIGPVKNNYISVNYSHRVKLTEDITLSMGLKGGIYNYKVALSEIALNEDDITFMQDYKKNFQPNLGAGAYLYTNDYYAGFSIPKFIKTDLEQIGTDNIPTELKRHIFLTGGYSYSFHPDWTFKPSILSKFVEGAPPSLDITAQALYMDKFWMGTTYRIGDALAFLFQVQVTNELLVGYSYDVTTSGMSTRSSGSHELLLRYSFDDFSKYNFLGTY